MTAASRKYYDLATVFLRSTCKPFFVPRDLSLIELEDLLHDKNKDSGLFIQFLTHGESILNSPDRIYRRITWEHYCTCECFENVLSTSNVFLRVQVPLRSLGLIKPEAKQIERKELYHRFSKNTIVVAFSKVWCMHDGINSWSNWDKFTEGITIKRWSGLKRWKNEICKNLKLKREQKGSSSVKLMLKAIFWEVSLK